MVKLLYKLRLKVPATHLLLKSNKKGIYGTLYSQAVTHPSTDKAQRRLTSVIGREPVFPTWCGRRWLPHLRQSQGIYFFGDLKGPRSRQIVLLSVSINGSSQLCGGNIVIPITMLTTVMNFMQNYLLRLAPTWKHVESENVLLYMVTWFICSRSWVFGRYISKRAWFLYLYDIKQQNAIY